MILSATADGHPPARRRLGVLAALAAACFGLWGVPLAAQRPAVAGAADTLDAARQIRRQRERSNAAIARHDTAGIGEMLAEHAIITSSNSAQSVGRQAMLQRFAEQFAARPDVTYRRTPSEVQVYAPWEMAAELGRWTGSWSDADGRVAIEGVYFAKWRRIGGRWLVEAEVFVPHSCRGSSYCQRLP